MEKQKRQSLNAEKRKAIADVFENHWTENSPMKQKHTDAINNYNAIKPKTYELVNNIVRKHQPQEDVNTIRSMISKYNSSGGDYITIIVFIYHMNICCLLYTSPSPRDGLLSRMPSSA